MATREPPKKNPPLTEERIRQIIREEMARVTSWEWPIPMQLPAVACYYMAVPVMHDKDPPPDITATITWKAGK